MNADTISEAFGRRARRYPHRTAVIAADGAMSYAELDAAANRLAHHLLRHGVRPGDPVGVQTERGTQAIAMLLAVVKAGAAYLALDPRHPAAHRRLLLDDAAARLVLAGEGTGTEGLGDVPVLHPERERTETDRYPATPPDVPIGPDSLAYVAYTSGSTGRPKGVAVPHRAVLRLVIDPDYLSIRPADVFLHFAPVAFDASTLEIWGALLNGGRLAVAPPGDVAVPQLLAFLRQQRVSVAWLTAGLFHRAVEAGLPDLPDLRYLLAGGDVLAPEHVDAALRALTGAVLVNGYGPTENTTFTCCHAVTGPLAGRAVPIGRPIRGTTAYVLDERLRRVRPGETGELYAAGLGLAHGYLGTPGPTAARFVADPFAGTPGQRMYRTGDLVRLGADGVLEFLGRRDSQVKLRGFRVELGAVEAAMTALPDVAHAAVVAVPAGVDRRLVAYVVGSGPTPPSSLALRAELARTLPGYAVPALVRVVPELPLTGNGKVDRAALAGIDTVQRPQLHAAYREPATAVERMIVEAWTDRLGIVGIGSDDDFFELGGDSLLAMTLIEELHRAFGVEVSLAEFYLDPTPTALAAMLPHGARPAPVPARGV